MYDLDFMLNGALSRQQHEQLIRNAEQENKAHIAQASHKSVTSLRAVMMLFVRLVGR